MTREYNTQNGSATEERENPSKEYEGRQRCVLMPCSSAIPTSHQHSLMLPSFVLYSVGASRDVGNPRARLQNVFSATQQCSPSAGSWYRAQPWRWTACPLECYATDNMMRMVILPLHTISGAHLPSSSSVERGHTKIAISNAVLPRHGAS